MEQAPRQHLSDIEPGHDRLAGPSIVSEEETQAGLLQHMLIDSKALRWQGINERNFGGKGRIKEVPVSQAFAFSNDTNNLRIGGEVNTE